MAYGYKSYLRDRIKEDPDLLRQLKYGTEGGATNYRPRVSSIVPYIGNNPDDSVFEQELTEALLEQIPAFIEAVDIEQLMTSLKIKDKLALKKIDDSKDQKERAKKLIEHVQSSGINSPIYELFTSLLAGAYPTLFRFTTKRLPTAKEANKFPSLFRDVFKRQLKQARSESRSAKNKVTNGINIDGVPYIKLQIIEKAKPIPSGAGAAEGEKGNNGRGVPVVKLGKEAKKIEKKRKSETKNGVVPYHTRIKLSENNKSLKKDDTLLHDFSDFLMRENIPSPKGKKLLMKGREGSGKTRTMEYLSDLWIDGEWDPGYTLVILLNLRKWIGTKYDKQRISALDILTDLGQSASVSNADKFFISQWLMNWSGQILLLMDGVDQVEHWTSNLKPSEVVNDVDKEASPLDICLNILHGNLLSQSTVLYASRDFTGLERIPRHGVAQIRGFDDDHFREFIREVHKHVPEDGRTTLKFIKNNPQALALCSSPFYCKELCRLLQEKSASLTDEFETRTRLTACIIMKHLETTLKKNGSKETLTDILKSPYLLKLAQLAFGGLFQLKKSSCLPKYLFTKRELEDKEVNMTQEEQNQAIDDGLLVNTSEDDTVLSFTHRTYQEFLAMALFVARHSLRKEKRKMVFNEMSTVKDDRFSLAKLFMYGLAYDRENQYVVRLKGAFIDHDHTDHHEVSVQEKKMAKTLRKMIKEICEEAKTKQSQQALLDAAAIAHETRSKDLQQEVNKTIFTNNFHLVLKDANIETFDMMGIISVIKEPIQMHSITINDSHLDPTTIKILADHITGSTTIQELCLCGIGSEGFKSFEAPSSTSTDKRKHSMGLKSFQRMLSLNTSIRKLVLDRNGIGDDTLLKINDGLSKLKFLRSLSLRDNKISEEGLTFLAESLRDIKHLTELYLDNNRITDEARKAISKCLVEKPQLRIFSIGKNTLSDESCPQIAEILKACKELERVDLSDNQIGTIGAKLLIDARRKAFLELGNNQIAVQALGVHKNLNVQGNTFGNRRVQIVTQSIQNGGIFRILNLEGINLTDEGFEKVAEAFRGNPDLVDLKLANNILTRRSVKFVNQLAFSCPSLKCIDISRNYLDKVVVDALRDIQAFSKKGIPELASTDEQSLKKVKKTKAVATKRSEIVIGYLPFETTKLDAMRMTVLDLSNAKLSDEQVTSFTNSLESNVCLRKMDFSNCGLRTSDIDSICQLLCRGTRLLHLGLASNALPDNAVFYLIQALERSADLRSLNLSNNSIGPMGMKLLFAASEQNPKFETLNLSGNVIPGEENQEFQEATMVTHQLKNLLMSGCCLEERTISQLFNIIRGKNTLSFLDISSNRITGSLAKDLSLALRENESLKALDLGDNKLGSEGMESLSQALAHNSQLVSLKLKKNCLGGSGAKVICDLLSGQNNLAFLDISENGFGSRGIEALVPGLKNNKSLRSLNISNNIIGVQGAKNLEKGLKGNTTLTTLNVSSNGILAKGTEAIAGIISSKGSKINCLDLSDNGMTDVGVFFLVERMLVHSALEELTLTKNNIQKGGLEELDRGLRNNNLLKSLDLSENWIDDEAAQWVCALMKNNQSTLISLNLSKNVLGESGARAIYQQLKQGTSLETLDWTQNPDLSEEANFNLHHALYGRK